MNVLVGMRVALWIFFLLRSHGLWYMLIEEFIGLSSKLCCLLSIDDETMKNNSLFYIGFYSWAHVFLRTTYEEWRHWSLISNLWKVYESCAVLTSCSQKCFWECFASLGQQKLWITVLQEKVKDLDNVWWYFSLLNGLGSEISQPNAAFVGSQHLYVPCLAVLPALRFFIIMLIILLLSAHGLEMRDRYVNG